MCSCFSRRPTFRDFEVPSSITRSIVHCASPGTISGLQKQQESSCLMATLILFWRLLRLRPAYHRPNLREINLAGSKWEMIPLMREGSTIWKQERRTCQNLELSDHGTIRTIQTSLRLTVGRSKAQSVTCSLQVWRRTHLCNYLYLISAGKHLLCVCLLCPPLR